ncbi:MAG: hypothetical protein OSA97_02800 [Nevskia sp.]|nr:hypothetical protein [Nevskia sp.]
MGQSAQCAGLVLFILFLWLCRFGPRQSQDQSLCGTHLVSAKELIKIIKDR